MHGQQNIKTLQMSIQIPVQETQCSCNYSYFSSVYSDSYQTERTVASSHITCQSCSWHLTAAVDREVKGKGKVLPLQARCGPEGGRGIALLFHDRGTRRGWVVSSTPRPHFTPGKDPVPILQETGWALGPGWTGGKSRPHRDSIPDRPARSESLYRLSCPAHW